MAERQPATPAPDSFAAWFAGELANRGWSAAEFARRAGHDAGGLNRTTVYHLLAGRRQPGPQAIAAIARVFGTPAAVVLAHAGHPVRPPTGPEANRRANERARLHALVDEIPDDLLEPLGPMLEGLAEYAQRRGGE